MSATATATMPPPRIETASDYRALADAYFRRSDELTDEDLVTCRRLMLECYERLSTGNKPLRDMSPVIRRENEELCAARRQFGRAIVQALRCRIDRTARSGHLVLTLDAFGELFPADLNPRRPARDRVWLRNMLDSIRPAIARR